jgi:hypothetical protein
MSSERAAAAYMPDCASGAWRWVIFSASVGAGEFGRSRLRGVGSGSDSGFMGGLLVMEEARCASRDYWL